MSNGGGRRRAGQSIFSVRKRRRVALHDRHDEAGGAGQLGLAVIEGEKLA